MALNSFCSVLKKGRRICFVVLKLFFRKETFEIYFDIDSQVTSSKEIYEDSEPDHFFHQY